MKIKYIIIFLPFSYACIPSVFISSISHQSIEKNSKIFISKFKGISMEENVFREKLNLALKREGYITVNNFQKSNYYLFINFYNHLQENVEQKSSTDIFLMELFLTDSKNIINNTGLPFDRIDALWVCTIELTRLDFLKHQDDIMENILKYFCNTFYGRRMLL